MGPVLYVMAILGCGDGGAACEQVRLAPASYASAEACNAASDRALLEATDVPYPMVMTECRKAAPNIVAQLQEKPRG